ncbi:TVP38/TMEM64 family protein [Longispora albida]|uniref:TVP38/TMEM64 family protein n=1 Tax=Longispora albida TaxID=203523 RepID=UPI000360AB70|nr:VTT domain-containing protein [Longispora albida]
MRAPAEPGGPQRRAAVRFAVLLAALAALGAALAITGPPSREDLTAFASGTGSAAPFVAVGGAAVLTLVMIPRTVLAFVGGLLFGTLAGGVYVLAGALLGASLAFAAGRLLGREFVGSIGTEADPADTRLRTRLRVRVARIDAWLGRRGILGVLAVRLLPIAPYGLMSYAFGTTATRYRDFLAGSFLGATPSSLAYAAIGAAALTASPAALAAGAAALGVLGLLGVAGASWARRRLGSPA